MNERQRAAARRAGSAAGYSCGGGISHRNGRGRAVAGYEEGGSVRDKVSAAIEAAARAGGAKGALNIDRANREQEPHNRNRARVGEAIEAERESPFRPASGVSRVDRAEDAALAPVEGKREGGRITAARRNALPASTFGLPGRRAYPMPDRSHAANAKARASQQVGKSITASQKAAIDAKADRILKR